MGESKLLLFEGEEGRLFSRRSSNITVSSLGHWSWPLVNAISRTLGHLQGPRYTDTTAQT